ncbi:MAG: hypothetical protein ABII23_05565 [bacterium]
MAKIGALRTLLFTLSRIPGLGFLRGIAGAAYKAESLKHNVDSVKQSTDQLKK